MRLKKFSKSAGRGAGVTHQLLKLEPRALLAATVASSLPDITGPLPSNAASVDLTGLFASDLNFGTVVRLDTSLGNIDIELFDEATPTRTAAPATVANFLNYVTAGSYSNTVFHRSVSGFVVQGGGFGISSNSQDVVTGLPAITTNPPVVNEYSSTRSNLRGTVAMAKVGGNPDSATSQFFFNLGNNSANLDNQNGGFTVFGRALDTAITSSMQVVDAIAAVRVFNAGGAFSELPLRDFTGSEPAILERHLVAIESATVLDFDALADTFSFTATSSNSSAVNPTISGSTLQLAIDPDASGTFTITVNGSNAFGETISTAFDVTLPNDSITPSDTTRPTAVATLATQATVGSGSHLISVQFADAGNLDVSTIATGDVHVTGPNGFSEFPTLTSVDSSANASLRTAVFTLTAPGGTWDFADNGTYTVSLVGDAVGDVSGNFTLAATLGSFIVDAPPPDTTRPTAVANVASSINTPSPTTTFTVVFSDDSAIDETSIASGVVLVTGPNGFEQAASLISVEQTSATTRTATFSITAPGGTWDVNDTGSYAVSLLPDVVEDASGNTAAGATLATFQASIAPGSGPDLRGEVTSTFKASSFISGAKGANVSVRVTNSGDAITTGTTSIRVLFSNDDIVDGADLIVGTINAKINLKPGASRVFSGRFNFPTTSTSGSFRLLAEIDAGSTISEANEINNLAVGSQSVTIAPPFVDLRGSIGKLPSAFKLGRKTTVPLSLFNDGNVAAKGTITVRLVASVDDVLDSNDLTIAEVPVRVSINPGKSGAPKATFVVPANLTTGTYRLFAVANVSSALGETDLSDNTLSAATTANVVS